MARVYKPLGFRPRVCRGKGKGMDSCTLHKPLPLRRVQGYTLIPEKGTSLSVESACIDKCTYNMTRYKVELQKIKNTFI
jgi:hypothetical protein